MIPLMGSELARGGFQRSRNCPGDPRSSRTYENGRCDGFATKERIPHSHKQEAADHVMTDLLGF